MDMNKRDQSQSCFPIPSRHQLPVLLRFSFLPVTRLASVFPALDAEFLFSRGLHWILVFPRLDTLGIVFPEPRIG